MQSVCGRKNTNGNKFHTLSLQNVCLFLEYRQDLLRVRSKRDNVPQQNVWQLVKTVRVEKDLQTAV